MDQKLKNTLLTLLVFFVLWGIIYGILYANGAWGAEINDPVINAIDVSSVNWTDLKSRARMNALYLYDKPRFMQIIAIYSVIASILSTIIFLIKERSGG